MQSAKKKKKYILPEISSKKIKLNFFYTPNERMDDSLNSLLGMNVLAQSPGGCGSGSSKSRETPI